MKSDAYKKYNENQITPLGRRRYKFIQGKAFYCTKSYSNVVYNVTVPNIFLRRMSINPNHILQLTDSVTGRRSVIRIDPSDCDLPVESLLDKYLKHADINHLVANKQVPEDSAETLASLQDLIYAIGENSQLTNMFSGVEFTQGEEVLSSQDFVTSHPITINDTDVILIDLVIDRENVGYERNWKNFNRRRWNLHASTFSDFVDSCFRDYTNCQIELDTSGGQINFIQSIAMRIWESDFENYSRFTNRKLIYKTGDETILNIMDGAGGICSEKVQALKFVTDHFGLESEIVFAGPEVPQPVPEDDLRELLSTFDFHGSNRLMRFWQHLALLYHLDGTDVLVDATNGNIPFLFLTNGDAERLLGYEDKSHIPVKMTIRTEDFYYHRIAQDIPEKLLFAMEGWIPDVDLVQVFDNELGLYISDDFMIAPIVYRTERAYEHQRQQYFQACAEERISCEINREWNLNSELGHKFISSHENVATKIFESKEHLLRRYDACHGKGHESGLVLIEING